MQRVNFKKTGKSTSEDIIIRLGLHNEVGVITKKELEDFLKDDKIKEMTFYTFESEPKIKKL